MTKPVTTCDVCGIEKKETNHWFKMIASETAVIIKKSDDINLEGMKDACGQKHAMDLVQQWFDRPEAVDAGI